MEKITKKAFMELHKANKLLLIQSCWGRTLLDVQDSLKHFIENNTNPPVLEGLKTSNVDVGNQGNCCVKKVYKEVIGEDTFFYLEEIHDNSKDKYTSLNNIQVVTILYKLKR